MIPVFRPSIGDEEIRAVTEVLRSGWIGLGPRTRQFEEAFAEFIGVRHAIGTNSATAALHLSLRVLGVGPGDEVLVPTITFVSTAHVVEYVGATPVFVDVDEGTLGMDLEDAARKITPRTKVLMPVHYGGRPVDLARARSLCDAHGLFLVEDAAHACGARYGDRWIGAAPRPLTCFSFHAVKNLTCGEGGMIVTDDDQLAKHLRELRWMGISRDTWDRSHNAPIYAWQYWVNELGYKEHLSDVAAALGLVQLSRLESMNARRAAIVRRYDERFAGLAWLRRPEPVPAHSHNSWHIYHVRTERRDDLLAALKRRDIGPGVHYYPIHLHPYYKGRGAVLPVAEQVWKEILTLPLYPDLTDAEVELIADTVVAFGDELSWKHPRVRGDGCVLREVESADLPKLQAWRNSEEGLEAFFTRKAISEAEQRAWYDQHLAAVDDLLYVIETAEGRAVGTIGLRSIDRAEGVAELGRFLIGESSARGRGLERAAISTLRDHAFSVVGLHRLFAELKEENHLARALFESCGFAVEGVLRGAYVADGVRRNKLLMACVR